MRARAVRRWLDLADRFPTWRWSWSGSLSLWLRAGMFGVGLEVGTQVLVGRGGHSDDATKPRRRLIEDEGLPGRVADGATTFLAEQDSGREIPFVYRLAGEGCLNATCGDQGQCIGDGVHGAAPSGLGERRPSIVPEFPRIDHDNGIAVMSGQGGDACAV